MSIQSLSIVVPDNKCINNCKFCVSRMHKDITYRDRITQFVTARDICWDWDRESYIRALKYARDLGCTTVMLTGECEPQQNMPFLYWLLNNKQIGVENIFHNIEMQTTGVGLNALKIEHLTRLSINTISLSVSSFDPEENAKIINDGRKIVDLPNLCSWIKKQGCLLRLSLNLNTQFYQYEPDTLFKMAKDLGADQVTLRKLYKSAVDCPQNDWIKLNCDNTKDEEYFNYVRIYGKPLERLPYGNIKYSVDGLGVVVDGDCMAKNNLDDIRYLILRPDCHLYTRWDDKGSIIF